MKKIMILCLFSTVLSIKTEEPVKNRPPQQEITEEIRVRTNYIEALKNMLHMLSEHLLARNIQIAADGTVITFYCGKKSTTPAAIVDLSKNSWLSPQDFMRQCFENNQFDAKEKRETSELITQYLEKYSQIKYEEKKLAILRKK